MSLTMKSFWRSVVLSAAMLFALCSTTWSQDIVVTGTITDAESGEPLPGVNVLIVGSQQGTVTNMDGLYEISLTPEQTSLNFTFVGYNPETIDVAGRNIIDIQLIPDIQALDEVVVVGYGTMRKKDLTGAVSSVKKSDIAGNKTSDALGLLQGKVAGLDLTQTSGEAGSQMKLAMRGTRSLSAGNQPLVIVDGVEYGTTTFDDRGREEGFPLDINSSDIQSIDVLKDAASTAIYGTRGANGVIIITTKSGGSGDVKVSFNSYMSFNKAAFKMDIQNGEEYAQKYMEKAVGDYENGEYYNHLISYDKTTGEVSWSPANLDPETGLPSLDMYGSMTIDELWQSRGLNNKYELITTDPVAVGRMVDGVSQDYLDMILRESISTNNELSITGGDEKTAFNLSFGYLDDNGLIARDKMQRYNAKLGVDHNFGEAVKVGADILFTKKARTRRDPGVFNQTTKCGPIGELYEEDGVTYRQKPDGIMEYNQINPLLDEVEGVWDDDIDEHRVFGSTYLNWNIIRGLSFRSSLATDFTLYKEGIFMGQQSVGRIARTGAISEIHHLERSKYTWDNVLNYKVNISSIHNLTLMAGSSVFSMQETKSLMRGFEQPLQQTSYYDFNGITIMEGETDFQKRQMLSYFGRVNYSLMDKYLFQATMRADGASVLDPEKRWASFPSVSAGWRISEEEFMKSMSSVINSLKIRGSWGISGNAAIQPYNSLTILGDVANYYSFGSQTYSQYVPYQPGNRDLTWERTKTINGGIDFTLLNNRVYGSVDYYSSYTYDLLFRVPLPLTSGFSEKLDNVAEISNKGIEIALTTVNVDAKNIVWSTDFTFARNKNRVEKIIGDVSELPYTEIGGAGFDLNKASKIYRVGEPANSYYTYDIQGIYSVDDLQAELEYVQAQQANGDSILPSQVPMIYNNFYVGNIKLADNNEDGQFTTEDQILMNGDPDFTASINSSLLVKTAIGNFGLDIFAVWRYGQTVPYGFYGRYKTSTDWTNGAHVDAWRPDNTSAEFPRWSSYGNAIQGSYTAPYLYQNGSFFKIKDVTVSYTLPESLLTKLPIGNLRFYASMRNMAALQFSKLDNYDAENDGSIDFPLPQQIFVGLNLDF